MPDLTNHGPTESISVLIVEDEFLIALDLQAMLEKQGHQVLGPVGRVEQALKLLMRVQPDVAVLDLNLYGQIATPVAERLRELRVPFIIASADASVVNGNAVFAGIKRITKPIQQKHLLSALQSALC